MDNYSPKITGGVITAPVQTFNTSIPLSWPSVTFTDQDSGQTIQYLLYYRYKSTAGGAFGPYTLITTLPSSTTTYSLNTSNTTTFPNGYYRVAIITFDGKEYSAKLSADKMSFIADNTEKATSPGPGTYTPAIATFLETNDLNVVHFQMDSLPYTVGNQDTRFRKVNMDFLRSKMNEAATSFGQGTVSWTDPTITVNLTLIKAQHVNELRTKGNSIRTAIGRTGWAWTRASLAAGTKIQGADLNDILALLEDFEH
jgi:hypothetical protein